jgi:hypothetical protein
MTDIRKLIKKLGSKEAVAEKLEISIRYVEMIRDGKRIPSARLKKLIQIYLTT